MKLLVRVMSRYQRFLPPKQKQKRKFCGGLFSSDNDVDTQARLIRKYNQFAAGLHFVSFVAALALSIIYAGSSVQTELTTDFKVFDANSTAPDRAGNFTATVESLAFYNVIWVDLPFPILTALSHFIIAEVPIVLKYYNYWLLEQGRGPLRWLEYGITASLMTWVILSLSGVTNIFTLIGIGVVFNVVLQWTGYEMENRNMLKNRRRPQKIDWGPMIIGWLIFLWQWAVIAAYFFAGVTSSDEVPWFVYSIIIGLFFQFALFGALLVARYALKEDSFFASPYGNEIGYITLSVTSKLFLTWNLLIGIISRNEF